MSDPRLVWALFTPLIAAALAVLLMQPLPLVKSPGRLRWALDLTALTAACMGPALQAVLLIPLAPDASYTLTGLGVTLAAPPIARLGIMATCAAIICALLSANTHNVKATITLCLATASLLGAALLSTDRLVPILCLFAAAVPVAALAVLELVAGVDDDEGAKAKRLAGALKQTALATIATGPLVAGVLMLARYPLNLENLGTLQAGLGLLAVGLAMRAGTMPFAASTNDLVEAAPKAAIVALGAVAPAALVVGMLIIAPFAPNLDDVSQAGRQAAMGLGALGAVLAGLRALSLRTKPERERGDPFALLVGASVALQTAWALFGVLSATREGTVGAALLTANLALAVPLAVRGRRGASDFVVAASLLGLPPLGGFAGSLLVSQAALSVGGEWLAGLLLGSGLVALGWLNAGAWLPAEEARPGAAKPFDLLTWTLIAAQPALFILAIPISRAL
jgi:formate hydrogenlyase subunit 3/multisubunit Na+/H+ antiporter MnhD subunit